MSSLEVRCLWLIPTRNPHGQHQGCPVRKQARGCMAAGPMGDQFSANPNIPNWSQKSGSPGWWRFVFKFASFVVLAFTRYWIPSNGVVVGGAAGRRPIWWCWVLKLLSDQHIQHRQHIDSMFVYVRPPWNLLRYRVKWVIFFMFFHGFSRFCLIFPSKTQPTPSRRAPRTTLRLELWSSTATWIRRLTMSSEMCCT